MDARFHISTDEEMINPVCDFTYSWCLGCGMTDADANRFTVAVSELVTDIILFAFPHESRAHFDIEFRHSTYHVELIVSEVGEPFDPDRHRYDPQEALQKGNFEGAGFRVIQAFCDEFVFINRGREGKEFRLTKSLGAQVHPIDRLLEQPALKQQPLSGEGSGGTSRTIKSYSVSQIRPADAEDISKLIYRTYAYTYSKEDMYFPKRIEKAVSGKERLGVIARSDDGEAIGYFAVLKKQDSNIAEVGEAVVSPDSRRQGVMSRMMHHLIDMARNQKLAALYGKAVTIHPVSQKVNAKFGFKTTALMLAETSDVVYKGFEKKHMQPVSLVIDFLPIETPNTKTVYLPALYEKILLQTYGLLRMPVKAAESESWILAEKSEIRIEMDYSHATSLIIVKKYGKDFHTVLTEMIRSLEDQNPNAIYLDLPLENPATPGQFGQIRSLGFIYCGLAPQFHDGADFLRLQRIYALLDLSLIEVHSEFGNQIKSLINGEYYSYA